MNATVIHRMALASLSGTLPFPEIVGNLIAEGVEYYRVDYVTRQFAFYGADEEVVTAPLVIENLPPIAPTLNVDALKAAIVDSQQQGQKGPRCSTRAMAAGFTLFAATSRRASKPPGNWLTAKNTGSLQ